MNKETTFRKVAFQFAEGVTQALVDGTLKVKEPPKELKTQGWRANDQSNDRYSRVLEIIDEKWPTDKSENNRTITESQIRSNLDLILSITSRVDTEVFDEYEPFSDADHNEAFNIEELLSSIKFIRAHLDGDLNTALQPVVIRTLQVELIAQAKRFQELNFKRKLVQEPINNIKRMYEQAEVAVKVGLKKFINENIITKIKEFQGADVGKEDRNIIPVAQLLAWLESQGDKIDSISLSDPSEIYTNFLKELNIFIDEIPSEDCKELIALLNKTKITILFTEDQLNRIRAVSEVLVVKEIAARKKRSTQSSKEIVIVKIQPLTVKKPERIVQ